MNAKGVLEAIIHFLHSQQNKKLLLVVYLLFTRFKIVGYAYLGNQITPQQSCKIDQFGSSLFSLVSKTHKQTLFFGRLVLLTPCYWCD